MFETKYTSRNRRVRLSLNREKERKKEKGKENAMGNYNTVSGCGFHYGRK